MYIDIIVAVIMVLSILLGLKKGFFFEVLSLFTLVFIVVVSKKWTPFIFNIFKEKIKLNEEILYYLVYAGILVLLYMVSAIILSILRKILPRMLRGNMDSVLGGVFGAIRGLFISFVFLVFTNLLFSIIPEFKHYSEDSKVNHYFLTNVDKMESYYPSVVNEKLGELNYKKNIEKQIEKYMSN
ncbi:MAG: CvpA family protein [Psychrilyobacter sp.]|nr:CvpA family protein [Psychrilyobacter sp.]